MVYYEYSFMYGDDITTSTTILQCYNYYRYSTGKDATTPFDLANHSTMAMKQTVRNVEKYRIK